MIKNKMDIIIITVSHKAKMLLSDWIRLLFRRLWTICFSEKFLQVYFRFQGYFSVFLYQSTFRKWICCKFTCGESDSPDILGHTYVPYTLTRALRLPWWAHRLSHFSPLLLQAELFAWNRTQHAHRQLWDFPL